MAKKDDKSNLVARDFMKKYKLDLIEIPQEFKDIELEEDYDAVRVTQTKAPCFSNSLF